MPNYSYACSECGHAFDIYQAFSDDALTTCPQCQGALRKKFSAVGVVFKGSGFYRNDARSASSTTESGASKNGTSKDGGKESAGTSGSDSGTTKTKTADGGSSASSNGTSSSGSGSDSGSTTKKTPAKAGASA